MADYSYERLSSESASFLERETPRLFAHTGFVLVFEPGPLARTNEGVDFARIRRAIESRLHRAPRFRQKLAWIPLEEHPVWVDDRDFRLDYHLRHTSLPRPGTYEQLENAAARILAQRLDRSRPPWECWVLEGLEGGRFAILLKVHLCMVDDSSGADLLQVILTDDPKEADPTPLPFVPRPRPSARELWLDEIVRQARLPRRYLERLGELLQNPERLDWEVRSAARGLAAFLGYTIRRPVEAPFNGRIGPHRHFATLSTSLVEAREVARELCGTVHDVVLATVAAGLRSFLASRLVSPAALDVRIATPIAIDTPESTGHRSAITEWVVDLPVWERDPRVRFEMIAARTRALAHAEGALPARRIAGDGPWRNARILSLGARALASHTPVNLAVTSVPGPSGPLYFAGARLLETYGQVPLRDGHGLGIAVLSYAGRLFWGLSGDLDLLPDLRQLATGLSNAFLELRDSVLAGSACHSA
ncbi:MAG: wax ester/triacylglycerol synthase family O-acyltransferase [Deltaproteobacteria bacterium]|nr:wax ester/triacylglycerol synthase family O-acyltransferase [Deltaproteobacteria bacterium]